MYKYNNHKYNKFYSVLFEFSPHCRSFSVVDFTSREIAVISTVEMKMNYSLKNLSKVLVMPAILAMALSATPALADCAKDLEAVKTMAPSAALSDEDKAKVETATQAAAAKQAAGDEDGCMAEITTAKMILRIE